MAEPEHPPTPEAGELDEALLRAISHPLRHRLLGMLDGRTASPNQLARELDLPLGRVSYHIRLLHDLGAIELVRTEPRRGSPRSSCSRPARREPAAACGWGPRSSARPPARRSAAS